MQIFIYHRLIIFINNFLQTYLQSLTLRLEEMRVKRRDSEQWMHHRLLPQELRERVRRYDQYKWLETRGVDEESLVQSLPNDLRRDIKRHLCLGLVRRVCVFFIFYFFSDHLFPDTSLRVLVLSVLASGEIAPGTPSPLRLFQFGPPLFSRYRGAFASCCGLIVFIKFLGLNWMGFHEFPKKKLKSCSCGNLIMNKQIFLSNLTEKCSRIRFEPMRNRIG